MTIVLLVFVLEEKPSTTTRTRHHLYVPLALLSGMKTSHDIGDDLVLRNILRLLIAIGGRESQNSTLYWG